MATSLQVSRFWVRYEGEGRGVLSVSLNNSDCVDDLIKKALAEDNLSHVGRSLVDAFRNGELLRRDTVLCNLTSSCEEPLILRHTTRDVTEESPPSKKAKVNDKQYFWWCSLDENDEMLTVVKTQTSDDEIPIPFDDNFQGNQIYIRPSYYTMERILDERACQKKQTTSIIIGTQGIGKSCFGLYLLYKKRLINTTVVYYCRKNYYVFSGSGHKVCQGREEAIEIVSKDEDALFIYDCFTNESVPHEFPIICHWVIITSPHLDNYKGVRNHRLAMSYYMPLWSLQELSKIFDKPDLKQLFLDWGGVPRNIANTELSNDRLEEALCKMSPKVLTNYVDGISSTDSGLYIHVNVSDELKKLSYGFASREICWKVFAHLRDQARRGAVQLLKLAEENNIKVIGNFTGDMLEIAFHSTVLHDTYRTRLITIKASDKKGQFKQFKLPKDSHQQWFNELQQLTELNVYYMPKDKNNAAFDSIYFDEHAIYCFQITRKEHKEHISANGLNAIWSTPLGSSFVKRPRRQYDFVLYLVVEEHRYSHRYTTQIPYKGELKISPVQYALCLDDRSLEPIGRTIN